MERREEQRLAKKRRKQEERLRRLEDRRSTNMSVAAGGQCRESSSVATFSDACSLSATSDSCELAGRNDVDVDLSARSCHVDDCHSDVDARRSPLDHIRVTPETAAAAADNEDGGPCRWTAAGSDSEPDRARFYSSSFSIWNILQASGTKSKPREQSSAAGYRMSHQPAGRRSLALYSAGGDHCASAWHDAAATARQLLMHAAITQPLGFQVERLATPPCVTGGTAAI